MKKIKKITTSFLIAATLILTAFECGPTEEPGIDTLTVNRTSWINEQHDTYEDEEGQMREAVEITILDLLGEHQGLLTVRHTAAHETNEEMIAFTYTHDRYNGTGRITITEGGETESYNFTYNMDNNTLLLQGTDGFHLLFHRVLD